MCGRGPLSTPHWELRVVSARTIRATDGRRSEDSRTVADPTWETPHPAVEPTCATGSGATSPTSFTVARAKPAVNLSEPRRWGTGSRQPASSVWRHMPVWEGSGSRGLSRRHGPVGPGQIGVKSGLSAASGVPIRGGSALAPTRPALRATGRGCGCARPAALGRAATHQGRRENLRPVRGVGHLIVLVLVNGRPIRIRPMLEQVETRVSRAPREGHLGRVGQGRAAL